MNKKAKKLLIASSLALLTVGGSYYGFKSPTSFVLAANPFNLKTLNLDNYKGSNDGFVVRVDGSEVKKFGANILSQFMRDSEDSHLFFDKDAKTYWLSSLDDVYNSKEIIFTDRFDEFASSYNDSTLSELSNKVKNMEQKKELADTYRMVRNLLTKGINGLYYQETAQGARAIDFDRIQNAEELVELVDGNTVSLLKDVITEKDSTGNITKVLLKYTSDPKELKALRDNPTSRYNIIKEFADKIIKNAKKNRRKPLDVNPKAIVNDKDQVVKTPIPVTKAKR